MKKVLVLFSSLAAAAVLTIGFAVALLLLTMFSTDDASGRHETFFGALVFESVERPDGRLTATAGVENPVPLIIVFAVLAVALTIIQITYRVLRAYRDQLIEDRGPS